MALVCIPNTLALASGCFSGACLSEEQRKAFLIYFMAKELAALGGTDYSADPNVLMAAAAAWQALNSDQRLQVLLEIYHQNALTAGATIGTTAEIAAAAKCFECIKDKDVALLFLTCFLGVHAVVT